MTLDNLLDQLIRSGRELAESARDKGEDLAQRGNTAFEEFAEQKLGVEADSNAGLAAKGAAAGAALLLLLGTRGGRALTGSALKLGSLAALGGLAYKTWQDWQTNQAGENQPGGLPIGELEGAAARDRAENLLSAMVAAANVDETILPAEIDQLTQAFHRLDPQGDAQVFISKALANPPTITELAAAVNTPTFAAEMYLSAASVLSTKKPTDQAWLNELGAALGIADELATQLRLSLTS